MTLSELMAGRTLDPAFEGQITADDMVLAVNLTNAKNVKDYILAQVQIAEHSGSLDSETSDAQYIRTGKVTTKTSTSRTITINGDRFIGDPFQDGLLSHEMKFGRGSAVVKDYVYFAIQNGIGEKGTATIVIDGDASGTSGENLTFSATLTSTSEPQEYTYTGA